MKIIKKHYLNGLILISAILAIIGYYNYFEANTGSYTLFDVVYSALRLFIFEYDFEYGNINIFLQISRFLAPASLATAIIQSFVQYFSSNLNKKRIKTFNNHIIFWGNDPKLLNLVQEQKSKKKSYVLINFNNNLSEQADYTNSLTFTHLSKNNLKDFRIYKSRYLIISHEDDLQSLDVATKLINLLDINQLNKKLEIILIFNNPEWAELSNDLKLLDKLNTKAKESPFLNIRYINYIDKSIRKFTQKYAPDVFFPVVSPDMNAHNILITGFNKISKRLIISLALNCHYINGKKENIYVLSENQNDIQDFIAKYQLEKMLEIHHVKQQDINQFNHEIDISYMCDVDPFILHQNLSKFNTNKNLENTIKIICSQNCSTEVFNNASFYTVYDINKGTDTLDALVDETLDEMAKTIHLSYLKERARENNLSENIDTHKEWEMLSDEGKDRNRYPADHIDVKIRSMKCKTVDVNKKDEEFNIADFPYIEQLSEAEHNRWSAYMYYTGWKHGKERDNKLKLHPDLIPYNKLSKEAQNKDKQNILQIPELLKLRNLTLVEIKQG